MREGFLKEVELELGSRGPIGLCPSSFLHLNLHSHDLEFGLGGPAPSRQTSGKQKMSHMEGTQIGGSTFENLKTILKPTENQPDDSKHCQ